MQVEVNLDSSTRYLLYTQNRPAEDRRGGEVS